MIVGGGAPVPSSSGSSAEELAQAGAGADGAPGPDAPMTQADMVEALKKHSPRPCM